MVDGLLLFMGGLLASSHCVGMCGGFVLTLGSAAPSWRRNLQRQLAYGLGRVLTYVVAGALCGMCGWHLQHEMRQVVPIQAILSILAGFALIVQALLTLGVLPTRPIVGAAGCSTVASFAALLRARGTGAVFVAGILNGFLPCGLVYAYLALAGSTTTLVGGALTMLCLGLGTIPALLFLGLAGSAMNLATRRVLFSTAAICLLIAGVMTVGRGVAFLHSPAEEACPACAADTTNDKDR